MLFPIKIVDIEITQSVPTFYDLKDYVGLRALVRLHGVPLGYINAPITQGHCQSDALGKLILEKYSWAIVCELLKNGLASSERKASDTSVGSVESALTIESLLGLPAANLLPVERERDLPVVTVAVCTRDRPEDMKRCLAAISQLDYPNLDILVVDNASKTDDTKVLIETSYPHVRYVLEPRPGLDWARNRAALEAKGEIIAYTDDDVVVDKGWVRAIAQAFVEDPEVMALTGLVVPYELETEAQVLFEKYGGFGRGFERKRFQSKIGETLSWQWLGGGQFGTGANMAYRRSIFEEIGYFDPALDVGTVTNGGGDLEMFVRVLHAQYALVYEPRAMIRHRHRREYAQLKRQISFNGSLYSLWYCIATNYPQQKFSTLKISIWWMLYWNLRRWIIAFIHPTQFPKELINAEFAGAFPSLFKYQKAQKRVREIVGEFGHQTEKPLPIHESRPQETIKAQQRRTKSAGMAVRLIDIAQVLTPLTDLESYSSVRIFVSHRGSPIGELDYFNNFHNIPVSSLARVLVETFEGRLLDPQKERSWDSTWANAVSAIAKRYQLAAYSEPILLDTTVTVSVVVATFDRPDDLRNCLTHLRLQETPRNVEIVVVDNHPDSGLTPPVVKDFPEVVLVQEHRQGLAYARNAGFIASSGDVLIATDDDVTMPPQWIETLVQPFVRPDVMIVTGNVLPLQLDNGYQQAFELYGGLGRGFEPFAVSGDWYELFPHKPSPTWSLGATANAAFRATMFRHPKMGLMDECLGPGMPSGVGEDTYLFYKAIKAGYTVVYRPESYVWHKHRTTEEALKKQLYGYSKGHVSYNLTTWLRDKDWRGLAQVLLGLPYAHYYRIKEFLLGRSDYPISLIFLEMRGNLAGPWSLWRSRIRVAKEGHSGPMPEQKVMPTEANLPEDKAHTRITSTQGSLNGTSVEAPVKASVLTAMTESP